jgi:response regulator RpfG family c-di-GMP phosphodiesterase
MKAMVRPCFLVVDREFASSISSRKLVIETAKFNVITAYSSREAIETLRRFPAVSGVVMDATLVDIPCAELAAALKAIQPKLVIVAISGPSGVHCEGADYHLDTFAPVALLELLRKLEPEMSEVIEAQNEALNRAEHGGK